MITDAAKHKATREAILYYGVFAVVLGGGAGVWLPLLIPGKQLAPDGLASYVFAILAPLLADAILHHEPYWKSLSKTKKMKLAAGCGLAGALALAALVRDGKDWDWTTGFLGVVVSLVVWYSISYLSGRFAPDDPTPPQGAQGGASVTPGQLEGGGLDNG